MNETLLIIIFVAGILALFGSGAWRGYLQWQRLQLEQADLKRLDETLTNMSEGKENDPRVGLENEQGVVRKRVDMLIDLRRRNGRLDFEAMSQIAEAQLTNDNMWIRYVAGVLILLGLLGTLFGLIGAVSGLSDTIASLNMSDVKKLTDTLKNFGTIGGSLVGTLGGMKTAFYASLFGVGTTIVLTLLLSYLTRKQNEFLIALDDLTLTTLAPRYFPQEQAHSLDQFVDAVKQTATILEHFENKFRTEVTKAESSFGYLKTLVSTFNKFTESFQGDYEKIQKELAGQIQNLQEIIKSREASTEQMVATINDMAAVSKDTLLQLQSAMTGFRQDIGANSADFKRQMEVFFERVVEGAFTESLKNFEKTVGTLQGLIANQEKATDALQALQNYFHEDRHGQAIAQSSDRVESKVGESIKILQEAVEKSAGNDAALLNTIVESNAKVENKVGESIKILQEAVEKSAGNEATLLNTLVESTAKVENKVAESITVLQDALAQSAKNEAALLELAKQVMESQKPNGRIFLAPPPGGAIAATPMNGDAVALLERIAQQTQTLNTLAAQLHSDGIRIRLNWLAPFRWLVKALRRPPEPILPPYAEQSAAYKISNPAGEA